MITMEDLSRVEELEKELDDIDYFIDGPTSFIYDRIEDPNQQELIECLHSIAYSNKEILERMKNEISKLRETINTKTVMPTPQISTVLATSTIQPEFKSNAKDLSEYIKLILFSDMGEDVSKKLSSLSREDKINIKLYFLKMINQTKRAIKNSILRNPVSDISNFQRDLSTYEIAIEFIGDLEREEELLEKTESSLKRVIFVPNSHNSTYLYEDITQYKDSKKEIKNIIDKIVEGYFLRTKDTKPIESIKSNSLYEYKHPNGIRVLYVVHKGLILICSLFYKDKQKSTRIEGYYEEAIRRFNNSKEYIIENNNNPDFFIEQDELIGQIYSFIDDISLSKKVGD